MTSVLPAACLLLCGICRLLLCWINGADVTVTETAAAVALAVLRLPVDAEARCSCVRVASAVALHQSHKGH